MGWKGYLASIFAVLVGPGLIYDNVSTEKERKRIASFEKKASGLIVGGESKRRRRGRSFKLYVEFSTELRGSVKKYFKVDRDFYEDHTSGDSISDPMVMVVYDPGDPKKSYLEGAEPDSVPVWTGALVGLAGIGGLVYGLKNRKG